jgi:TolB protein
MTRDQIRRVGARLFSGGRRPSRYLVGLAIAAAVGGAVSIAGGVQASPSQQPQQPSEVELAIRGEGGTPPRYAVPDFVALSPDAADVAKVLGQVLWDDLDFEREFYMVPRDVYGTVPVARSVEQIPFPTWREVGADAVVFGTVQRVGAAITVQIRLFNVRTRTSVFSKEYTGSATANPRQFAHTAADEIHMQQRQLKGVARSKLAFVSNRIPQRQLGTVQSRDVKEIWMSDYDGANQRRITVTRDTNINPNWSPDGQALAYTSYRRVAAGGQPDIFLSFIYKGLLETPAKAIGGNYIPVFSPDGSKIAFMSTRDDYPDIYVMNRDGSGIRRLTNDRAGDSAPTWSPSGAQIAFVSDRAGSPQIYIINADGSGGLRRLPVTTAHADKPSWSPVHNEIAYTARVGGGFDIHVHDLSTGQTRSVTFGEGSNESPAYSGNGRHIAFQSTRSGRVQIFTIGRDGKGLKQITRDGNNESPAWSN